VRDKTQQPETAAPGVAVSGFPEPPGADPGDVSRSPVDGMAFADDRSAHTPVEPTSTKE
jgi:hypothetical protein